MGIYAMGASSSANKETREVNRPLNKFRGLRKQAID